MADNILNDRPSLIRIPNRYEIPEFENGIKLRNELYELKEELCSYLRNIFNLFWNNIDDDVRVKFNIPLENWPEERWSIHIGPEISEFIIKEIEKRQTIFIKRCYWQGTEEHTNRIKRWHWQGTEEHKRRLAKYWIISNGSLLTECFIPMKNLVDLDDNNFSFEYCEPAQLFSVCQNYKALNLVLVEEVKCVRMVRNRYIAHLRKLDEVTSELYMSKHATLDSFRRCLQ